MVQFNNAFGSFSVNSIQSARDFYGSTIGLKVAEDPTMAGILNLDLDGCRTIIYEKTDHIPATFTILNFPVDDVEMAVDELKSHGVIFEVYDYPDLKTDERGILTNGNHQIAWFKDPAGNILSVLKRN